MAENTSKLKKTIATLEKQNRSLNREYLLLLNGMKDLMPELKELKRHIEATRIKIVHLEVLSRAASDPVVE